jgi:hypothetical protein
MPLDESDLIFCVGNAPWVPLLDRLAPARAAGYSAISLLPHEYAVLHDSGMSDPEIRQRVADEGMALGELDGLCTWLPNHTPPASFPAALGRALDHRDRVLRSEAGPGRSRRELRARL